MRAFHGRATVKDSLLKALANDEDMPVTRGYDQQVMLAWARDIGLPGDFVFLISGLARHSPQGAARACHDPLAAVEPGGDISTIARQWLVWSIETMLAPALSTPALHGVAKSIQRLHARVSPSPTAWRTARRDLACMDPSEDESGGCAILLAACWDLERVPGAIDDVLTTWHRTLTTRLHRTIGWTEQDRSAFQAIMASVGDKARCEAGTMPDASDRMAMDLYKTRLVDAYEPLVMARDAVLARRGLRILRGAREETAQFSDEALAGLVTLVSGLFPGVASPVPGACV